MIALFKSHYSIGKSILTLDHPDKIKEGGPDSIFNVNKDTNQIVLVEDSLVGFLQAQKTAESLGVQLVFGLKLNCSHEKQDPKEKTCVHKVIIFAKNDSGCRLLNSIYSDAFCNNEGVLILSNLNSIWDESCLEMAIPFYDSFIFMNHMHFCSCIPNFSYCDPTFFIEDNHLPFDSFIKDKVLDYCDKFSYNTSLTKSIYYNKRSDFEAYQTYRCICAKKNGKQRTLSVPNFDHLASPEFCYESYYEQKNSN
jgi:DNA polymerase III alpha subunit